MENKLRLSGFLFAAIFLLGYLINITFILIRGDGLIRAFFEPMQLLQIVSIFLFLSSSYFAPLRWIQPVVFLATSPISIVPDPQNIYGLGYFIIGVVLLERAGFFLKHRAIKLLVAAMYLLAQEIVAVFYTKRPIADAVSPTFYILAFALFLWFLYKDRLVIYLAEPKPRISLSEKGLSHAERTYVQAVIEGKSTKEICVDYDVAESTVRNTVSRACKKLEVEDSGALAVLAATHEVVA